MLSHNYQIPSFSCSLCYSLPKLKSVFTQRTCHFFLNPFSLWLCFLCSNSGLISYLLFIAFSKPVPLHFFWRREGKERRREREREGCGGERDKEKEKNSSTKVLVSELMSFNWHISPFSPSSLSTSDKSLEYSSFIKSVGTGLHRIFSRFLHPSLTFYYFGPFFFHSFIKFSQQILTEYFLCVRYCSRYWTQLSKTNKNHCPYRGYIPGVKDRK